MAIAPLFFAAILLGEWDFEWVDFSNNRGVGEWLLLFPRDPSKFVDPFDPWFMTHWPIVSSALWICVLPIQWAADLNYLGSPVLFWLPAGTTDWQTPSYAQQSWEMGSRFSRIPDDSRKYHSHNCANHLSNCANDFLCSANYGDRVNQIIVNLIFLYSNNVKCYNKVLPMTMGDFIFSLN